MTKRSTELLCPFSNFTKGVSRRSSKKLIDSDTHSAGMKYATSPTPSRSNSSLLGMSSRTASPLPAPANYRDCMSATTKSYKYLRRFIKFDQMDFEYAMWQMVYLFIAPKKVYRNFNYRKREQFHCAVLGRLGSTSNRLLFPSCRNQITICSR